MQVCKLLHLLGIPSSGAGSLALMAVAYSLPFIRQISRYTKAEQLKAAAGGQSLGSAFTTTSGPGSNNGISPGSATAGTASTSATLLHPVEVSFYVVVASLATFWAWQHGLAEVLLLALLGEEPSALQAVGLCGACWLAYLGCIMFVFFRDLKLLRRYSVIRYLVYCYTVFGTV